MSLTDANKAPRSVVALIDVIERVALASTWLNAPAFFPRGPDPRRETYFEPVRRSASAAVFDYPGGSNAGSLIEALASEWIRNGDDQLLALVPSLRAVADELADEANSQRAEPSVFCYAMF